MSTTTAQSIEIYGVEYRVRGGDDPEFTAAVARVVDQRMREIGGQTQVANQAQLAVLTLMNVTGELLRQKQSPGAIDTEIAHEVRKIADRVSAALSD